MDTLNSRVVYENPWMTVREDEYLRSDGSRGLYGVVEKADYVVVIPYADDGFWLVEQYRYPLGRRYWEFPQGSWEDASAEPLTVARSELEEEAGLVAARVVHLGRLHSAYGYSNQAFHVYLASELVDCEPRRGPDEQDMQSEHFSERVFKRMIESGEIADAATVAAYTLYLFQRAS
jgi:8-oxo-dGTP pyrophosphatase MutT (NUDIX family)